MKLEAKGWPRQAVVLFCSWLRHRKAKVVVNGTASHIEQLCNMVFQGTVFGPPLWNEFFEDARHAINATGFQECVFADDLQAFRAFDRDTSEDDIMQASFACQVSLHKWGQANQVVFDGAKEKHRILSAGAPANQDCFKLLGIKFDNKLCMNDAIESLIGECNWKVRGLLRVRKYYSTHDMVLLYKTHILPYIEFRTPAIYHAADAHLNRVNSIQVKFLQELQIPQVDALLFFNLAPLSCRRDMAMLGVLHRAACGKGPECLGKYFQVASAQNRSGLRSGARRHKRHLADPWFDNTRRLDKVSRSAFGLIFVYNLLPPDIIEKDYVSDFQGMCQNLLKSHTESGAADWKLLFSPRWPRYDHPLLAQ